MSDIVKLPLAFDPARLLHDLDQIPADLWVTHFNAADHDGGWSVLALYSPTGASSFIVPMQMGAVPLVETPALLQSSYLQDVVASFQCPKRAVRLMRLHAGSVIKEHSDPRLNYAHGVMRLHVPIRTNPAVECYVNGARVVMHAGECWYVDFTLPHRVLNLSAEERVHLVIDCEVNAWLRQLCEPLGLTDSSHMHV